MGPLRNARTALATGSGLPSAAVQSPVCAGLQVGVPIRAVLAARLAGRCATSVVVTAGCPAGRGNPPPAEAQLHRWDADQIAVTRSLITLPSSAAHSPPLSPLAAVVMHAGGFDPNSSYFISVYALRRARPCISSEQRRYKVGQGPRGIELCSVPGNPETWGGG